MLSSSLEAVETLGEAQQRHRRRRPSAVRRPGPWVRQLDRPSSPGRPAAGHTKEQPACVLSRCWSGAPDLEYRGAAVRDEIRGAVPDLKQSCDGTSFKFGMYQTRSPPYFANRLIQVDVQSAIVDQGWAALAPIRTYVIHFWAGSSRAGERRLTCFIISICLISWSEN